MGSADRHAAAHDNTTDLFVEAADPRLVELRLELVQEAREWLGEFERHRDPQTRGLLVEALADLALLGRP